MFMYCLCHAAVASKKQKVIHLKAETALKAVLEEMSHYFVGRMKNVPVGDVADLDQRIRSRKHDPGHKEKLKKLAIESNQGAPDVVLVVLVPAHLKWEPYAAFIKKHSSLDGPIPMDCDIKTNGVYASLVKLGLNPVAGEHSTTAMQELHDQYPRNVKFAVLKEPRLFILPDTPANRALIKDFGDLDNTIKDTRKKTTWTEHVYKLHDLYMAIYADDTLDEKAMKKKIGLVKEQKRQVWGVKPGVMNQMGFCAKYTGDAWHYMDMILKGNVEGTSNQRKKFKVPRSGAPFTKCGGIPDGVFREMLRLVATCQETIGGLGQAASRWKASNKIITEIVKVTNCKNFDGVREKFPSIGNDAFVMGLVPAVMTNKAFNLHWFIKKTVREIFTARDVDQEAKKPAVSECWVCWMDLVFYFGGRDLFCLVSWASNDKFCLHHQSASQCDDLVTTFQIGKSTIILIHDDMRKIARYQNVITNDFGT